MSCVSCLPVILRITHHETDAGNPPNLQQASPRQGKRSELSLDLFSSPAQLHCGPPLLLLLLHFQVPPTRPPRRRRSATKPSQAAVPDPRFSARGRGAQTLTARQRQAASPLRSPRISPPICSSPPLFSRSSAGHSRLSCCPLDPTTQFRCRCLPDPTAGRPFRSGRLPTPYPS